MDTRSEAEPVSLEARAFILHHVFLPADLPHEDDTKSSSEEALIAILLSALKEFHEQLPLERQSQILTCIEMLQGMLNVRLMDGNLSEDRLKEHIGSLKIGGVSAIQVRAQNAGLIIRRLPEHYRFEVFELSPTCEAVMGCHGRLIRQFPGKAVIVSQSEVQPELCSELAKMISALHTVTRPESTAYSTKAGRQVSEIRDTAHPMFITDLLMEILGALGASDDRLVLTKHTRDDVLYDNARLPWRRSSLWLLLRVALQSSLRERLNDSDTTFKSLMVYFMTRFLDKELSHRLVKLRVCDMEGIFIMQAKIHRRLQKLGPLCEPFVLPYVKSVMDMGSSELSNGWNQLQNKATIPQSLFPFLENLNAEGDTTIDLKGLKNFVIERRSQEDGISTTASFSPLCSPRNKQDSSSIPSLRIHGNKIATYSDPNMMLADIEAWVETHFDSWLNQTHQGQCCSIADLIKNYSIVASKTYAGNPEALSRMILALVELWIGLDKCTIALYPMMEEYQLNFNVESLEKLLLVEKTQLKRLQICEDYFKHRNHRNIPELPSIFSNFGHELSFGVRYFKSSRSLQDLRDKILSNAQRERDEKRKSFRFQEDLYNTLVGEVSSMECDYRNICSRGRIRSVHDYHCNRCAVEKRAEKMSVNIHEWPLPEKDLQAMGAVFEMAIPKEFSIWRDTTHELFSSCFQTKADIGKNEVSTLYYLNDLQDPYAGLGLEEVGRIGAASIPKPFTVSHYSSMKMSQATEESTFVQCGLKLEMYDTVQGCSVSDRFVMNLTKVCSFKIQPTQDESLMYMQSWLEDSGHSANTTLSKQDHCPKSLTLHEFYAFSNLRCGSRLQWRNIALCLASQSLNFNQEETTLLILQAAWQAGPAHQEKICRDSHMDLEDHVFVETLIQQLNTSLTGLEQNWQNQNAVYTFVLLACRCMSLSDNHELTAFCCSFIRRARSTLFRWMNELQLLLNGSKNDEEARQFKVRLVIVALSCYSTFNVEPENIAWLLITDDDFSQLGQCCVMIHDNTPSSTINLPYSTRLLLTRYWGATYRLEGVIRDHFIQYPRSLHAVVHQNWSGYLASGPWSIVPQCDERWLYTTTESDENLQAMTVHYNVMNGSLLINGVSLTRLPPDYESHQTYRRLFGERILDVAPSSMPGMTFEARTLFQSHQVFFRMKGEDLVIRAKFKHEIFEVIPSSVLQNDFPSIFIDQYIHWLNLKSGQLEFRPSSHPWRQSIHSWRTSQSYEYPCTLQRSKTRLFNIHSPTARAITNILQPLEKKNNCVIELEHHIIHVTLPRYNLNFDLKWNKLFSKQFRGYYVDPDQRLGTLTGLENKLILKKGPFTDRKVIVPDGEVSFLKEEGHVRVRIIQSSLERVNYHTYDEDCQLGQLRDKGKFRSKLYKAYLHAVTSYCLVDSLSGRTGTEEALRILQSASFQSFIRISSDDQKLLGRISSLSPTRNFYPQHKKVMQTVKWNAKLPRLSQHEGFHKEVFSIIEHASLLQIYQENKSGIEFKLQPRGNEFLATRATQKFSRFRVAGFGGEDYDPKLDCAYTSRDTKSRNYSVISPGVVTKLVHSWRANFHESIDLFRILQSWKQIIRGPMLDDEKLKSCRKSILGFSFRWLDYTSLLRENWCNVHLFLVNCTQEQDRYKIAMALSMFAFNNALTSDGKQLIYVLLAMATNPEMRLIKPPECGEFKLTEGSRPVDSVLTECFDEHVKKIEDCPEHLLVKSADESDDDFESRRKHAYEKSINDCRRDFLDELTKQWPSALPSAPTERDYYKHIELSSIMVKVRENFTVWYNNGQFEAYIKLIQEQLDQSRLKSCPESKVPRNSFQGSVHKPILSVSKSSGQYNAPALVRLMQCEAPSLELSSSASLSNLIVTDESRATSSETLKLLIDDLVKTNTAGFGKLYASGLQKSFEAMNNCAEPRLSSTLEELAPKLGDHYNKQGQRLRNSFDYIKATLTSSADRLNGVPYWAPMLPRITPSSILDHLAWDRRPRVPSQWHNCITSYALTMIEYQRAERLKNAKDPSALLDEIWNTPHANWDPFKYSDWLLLELENRINIRNIQARIAQEMMFPTSGKSSVMQLNMGLGKSSVIVPIVASTLADSDKLVRVIVLKPLAMQMHSLLAQRLGGLMNRRIYYMPISRSLRLNMAGATSIQSLLEKCMKTGGILLTQPEFLLSFELLGYSNLLACNLSLGEYFAETQRWLNDVSRDIIDESDAIFDVKFELTYAMGTQNSVEMSPDRWLIIAEVLSLLERHARKYVTKFPHSLEVLQSSEGSFSRIRILEANTGAHLLREIARFICDYGIRKVMISNLKHCVREAVFKYITEREVNGTTQLTLQDDEVISPKLMKTILLLRGLFAHGILSFVLGQKRWRVNYGLDLQHRRSMLAVPYTAKDTPSARAEFSHPDTTIVLTCLSYYYGGLTSKQIFASFERLLQSDQAQEQYDDWVRAVLHLPASFRQVNGVNLSNPVQCEREVFPHLRFSTALINFYISNIVFPKEMKEFTHKLSSSGWEIAREKKHPTTGFSGTNDNKLLLPSSIEQQDLPELISTNAEVLELLLRPENCFKDLQAVTGYQTMNADTLLRMAVALKPSVRVILDAGAQVLELRNEELAREWLRRISESEVDAAIFLNDDNEICVLNRQNEVELLSISPFESQMDRCLVYLDEAHTRGVDLKMPTHYRAIVTLGPGLTKDHLAQACMRMRRLGKGQSVVFCCSADIQRNILLHSNREVVEVSDVLKWVLEGSQININKGVALWASQGLSYQRRMETLLVKDKIDTEMANKLLEPEAKTLEQRYGVSNNNPDTLQLQDSQTTKESVRSTYYAAIREKCSLFNVTSLDSSSVQEEQERELAPENEREQMRELPPQYYPHDHRICQELRDAMARGYLETPLKLIKGAFLSLGSTSAVYGSNFEANAWPNELLVTDDFERTVKLGPKDNGSWFIRPVQYIISFPKPSGSDQDNLQVPKRDYVIVSPREAQEFLPTIRENDMNIVLHFYAPRSTVSMSPLEDLMFASIPVLPKAFRPPINILLQLQLFSGQLYLCDYSMYKELCSFLGLRSSVVEEGIEVDADGFVHLWSRELFSDSYTARAVAASPFNRSPLPFLREIFRMRRKDQDFSASHMGRLLDGELLTERIFDRVEVGEKHSS